MKSAGLQLYRVALEPRMTVLDALFLIQREQDPSLVFRCSCRVGMCGTCGVSVNGIPRLACKTRIQSLEPGTVRLSPLPHLPVQMDLIVSMEPFMDKWKEALPALRPIREGAAEPARIPRSSPFARAVAGKGDCITCGICFSACGIKGSSDRYLGPAALNKALLRLLDPRDGAKRERLAAVNSETDGLWRCHTQFNCTTACPKGIDLTESIVRLKRGMLRPRRFLHP